MHIKINIDFNFWRWLCRFAYSRLKETTSEMPLGIPGNRDPSNKCPSFAPRDAVKNYHDQIVYLLK